MALASERCSVRGVAMLVLAGLMALAALGALGAAEIEREDLRPETISALRQRLDQLARRGDPEALAEFVDDVVALEDPRVVSLISRVVLVAPERSLRQAVLRGLVALRREDSVEALVARLEDRKVEPLEKGVILEAFGLRKDPRSAEAILSALDDRVEHVRLRAILAATERRLGSAVAPLAAILDKTWRRQDRTWVRSRDALRSLTGLPLDSRRELVELRQRDLAAFTPVAGLQALEPETVSFLGQEVRSRNVLFLVDVGVTMLRTDAGGAPPESKDPELDGQRYRRVRRAIEKALRELPSGARFNVMAYTYKVVSWRPSLRPATPANVEDAVRFFTSIHPADALTFYGSADPFGRDPDATGEIVAPEKEWSARKSLYRVKSTIAIETALRDRHVDTVVLVGDVGQGSEFWPEEERLEGDCLLELLRRVNRTREVRIDTFAFRGTGAWPRNVITLRGAAAAALPPADREATRAFVELFRVIAEESLGEAHGID